MWSRLRTLADLIDGLSDRIGHAIAWLTLGTVIITFVVVVMRYLFQTGSIALQESISYLHAAVFMLGAAYTLRHDGHVRVDIVYRKLSARARAWVDLAGSLLLLLPVCTFILLISLEYVVASWAVLEGSQEASGLNAVFLLKTLIPVMAVLLLLQGCAQLLRSVLLLAGQVQTHTDAAGLDREL